MLPMLRPSREDRGVKVMIGGQRGMRAALVVSVGQFLVLGTWCFLYEALNFFN